MLSASNARSAQLSAIRNSIMKSLKFAAAALVCLSVIGSAGPVSAEIVLSNSFANVGTFNSTVSGSNYFATGFTTGTNANFLSLQSVNLSLATSGTAPTATPVVQLFSGSGSPTTLVGSFSSQSVTVTNPNSFAFNYLGSASLLPSTTYWVVMSATASEAFGWYLTNGSPTQQNASGYAFITGKSSADSGGSWSDNPLAGFGAVSITAVPEPSSIILAGLGVLAAGFQLRRRMKRA